MLSRVHARAAPVVQGWAAAGWRHLAQCPRRHPGRAGASQCAPWALRLRQPPQPRGFCSGVKLSFMKRARQWHVQAPCQQANAIMPMSMHTHSSLQPAGSGLCSSTTQCPTACLPPGTGPWQGPQTVGAAWAMYNASPVLCCAAWVPTHPASSGSCGEGFAEDTGGCASRLACKTAVLLAGGEGSASWACQGQHMRWKGMPDVWLDGARQESVCSSTARQGGVLRSPRSFGGHTMGCRRDCAHLASRPAAP